MLDPTFLKWLHILGATLLFGTGLGTAFHGLASHLRGDVRAIVTANRNVVLADWLFTAPAVVLQPVTGVLLARAVGWDLTRGWIMASIGLYLFTGLCWLPVVWLQLRMKRIADLTLAEGGALPPQYWRLFRWWFALGWPAFAATLTIFWLMVAKPEF